MRLSVTRLAHRDAANYGFALAELQVLAAGKNVAERAAVTAADSIEAGAWSKAKLVDGRLLPERGGTDISEQPATMLRKDFDLRGPIKRAVASVTGLGLYELSINGQRVGDHVLAPDWTRYSKRIQYQTYDVTALVRNGRNAVGAQLGGGWWTGPLMCMPPWPRLTGNCLETAQFCLLMRLDVELADGTTQSIVTDPSWQATTDGPIRRAGIYFGETYDATKEKPGWDKPGFSAAGWRPVQVLPHPSASQGAALVAQGNEPIRVIEELRPVKMTEPKPGVYVFDLGQNMVGWCRLKATAPAGTKINVRYAEMLNDDGTIYTANLRGAVQINEYTWRGGQSALEPHFTYHGFRYVEVTGLPGRPAVDTRRGPGVPLGRTGGGPIRLLQPVAQPDHALRAMGTAGKHDERAHRLSPTHGAIGLDGRHSGLRANGDFSTRHGRLLHQVGARHPRVAGRRRPLPRRAPHISDPNTAFSGVPAWGDAGTVVPWRMYQNYADARMIAEHFESAKRWVDFIAGHNPNLLWQKNRGNDYNDWLNGDVTAVKDYPRGISAIPNEVFATAFFAHSTEIVAHMARVLGRSDDAAKYGQLLTGIKAAFGKAYVAADGRIKGDTQSGYALALHFNLLDESLRPVAIGHLLEAIKKYKFHPSTGIQSTHRMLLELSGGGQHAEAYRLMTLRTRPRGDTWSSRGRRRFGSGGTVM